MERVKKTLHYLSHLEWTEKKQDCCIFCEPGELKNPLFEVWFYALSSVSAKANYTIWKMKFQDDDIIAVDNIRKAGLGHWLIIPKVGSTRHIRDCEALTEEDIPLRKPKAAPHSTLSYTSYHFGKKNAPNLEFLFCRCSQSPWRCKRETSLQAFSQHSALCSSRRLSSWTAALSWTSHLPRYRVNPSSPFACHHWTFHDNGLI